MELGAESHRCTGPTEDPAERRYREIMDKLDAYWSDLLRQGSIHAKSRGSQMFVLKFRQRRSGRRDGGQTSISLGRDPAVLERVEAELWRRRLAAGCDPYEAPIRFRPQRVEECAESFGESLVRMEQAMPGVQGHPVWNMLKHFARLEEANRARMAAEGAANHPVDS